MTVSKGWVTLRGEVAYSFQRDDAERVVRRLTGVRGVTNLITVRPPSVTPTGLRKKIEDALVRNAELDAQRIKVDVQGGKVILTGTVRSWAEKQEAERAVHLLIAAGFRPERISILARHPEESGSSSDDKGALGLVTGMTVGTAVGSVLPLLLGSAALAIPGVGPIVALGPIVAALTLAVSSGLVGGLVGFLVGQGLSTEDAERYADEVAAGAHLVLVQCDPVDEERAAARLVQAGAVAPTRASSVPAA